METTVATVYMRWASNFLFEGLSPQQLSVIEPHMKLVNFNPGEILMEEGEPGDFMLLIIDGTVDIFIGELMLAKRGPQDLVGLMALIEGCPRSATVTAGKEHVKAFKIDRTSWQEIMSGDIRAQILHNYLIYQQNTIRATDAKRLEEARVKLKIEQMRVLSARFFVQMVIGLIIFTFALGSLNEFAAQVETTYVSFGVLFVYAAWSFVFSRQSGLPKEAFGLTMKNFKPAIKLTLAVSMFFIAGMFILKWAMITLAPETYGSKIISVYENDSSVPLAFIIVIYSMHAVMQEYIARACIQGGLHQFISGKGAAITAIVLATLMFSVFHLMLDMRLALLTIIPSLLWGFLFYRQRNFVAVAISHILIGIVAIFILGIV